MLTIILQVPIIMECAIEVGSKVLRQDTSKLSRELKSLIKKHQRMKAFTPTTRIELAELSDLINKREVDYIRKYNIKRLEHAKKRRKPKSNEEETSHSKKLLYALRHKEGNVTTNMEKIVKVVEGFYRGVYSCWASRTIMEDGVVERTLTYHQ